MKLKDFMVGQTVFVKTIVHCSEPWKKERINEVVVSKVGKRYVTVKDDITSDYGWKIQFDSFDDFKEKTEYSPTYELFLRKQDILDRWRSEYLAGKIRSKFGMYNIKDIGLRTLEEIANLLCIPLFPTEKEGGAEVWAVEK